jgi:hypothetical protein
MTTTDLEAQTTITIDKRLFKYLMICLTVFSINVGIQLVVLIHHLK